MPVKLFSSKTSVEKYGLNYSFAVLYYLVFESICAQFCTRCSPAAFNYVSTRLRVLFDERDTLLDVLCKISQASLKETLLMLCELANIMDFLNTVWSELDF